MVAGKSDSTASAVCGVWTGRVATAKTQASAARIASVSAVYFQ